MRCLVTGGTGFLGSALVRLLKDRGLQPVPVSRRQGQDITRAETLEPLFENCRLVFHLAALVQSRPGPFEDINVLGLRNILQLCERFGVERLVYVSSFTVFGPSAAGPHREEQVPERSRFFHGYDRSKYQGYRLAQQWKSRLPLNVVFPTVIYGPGPLTEGNILVRLFRRWARLRLAPLPLYGRPRWNFVFVEDVAQGLLLVSEAPAGEDFILGGENHSLRELCQAFGKAASRSILPLGLPAPLFRLGCHLEDWASRLFRFPPLALPQTAGFFLADWEFSSDKARSQLDYRPRPLSQGLDTTQRWMRDNRLI